MTFFFKNLSFSLLLGKLQIYIVSQRLNQSPTILSIETTSKKDEHQSNTKRHLEVMQFYFHLQFDDVFPKESS